jgi:dCTP deaminase
MPAAGFWSSETLKRRVPAEKIVDPYEASAVNACCYELSVGEEAFVTGESAKVILTHETLKMPLDVIGLLSIKFGWKARGLINVSGFHVDPGFEGKLVFSMYNAGVQTIHLGFKSRLFLLWLCPVDEPTSDKYHGKHNKQEHLPDEAITNLAARMPSPFSLEKDLESLRNELRGEVSGLRNELQREVSGLKTILTVAGTLAVAAFLASLKSCGIQPSPPPPVAVYLGSTPASTSATPVASATSTPAPTISGGGTPIFSATVGPSATPRP